MLFTSVRVRKVVRDIWVNKSKTLMIVLATAVGVFAFGTLSQTWAILDRDLTAAYRARNPAQATLVTEGIDEAMVKAVGRMAEVEAVQGRRFVRARFLAPGGSWKVLILVVLDDFVQNPINQLHPQAGPWPPPQHGVVMERASLAPLGIAIGSNLLIELPDGEQKRLPIVGALHDVIEIPGSLTELAFYGYITLDTAANLGLPTTYNQLNITVRQATTDVAHIQQVAQAVEKRLQNEGYPVFGIYIPEPGQHILHSLTRSLFLILNLLGIFTLLFTTLLIVNTISGLLAGQIQQIGVMKAIGAPRRDLIAMYVAIILVFSGLALVLATPLGMIGASYLSWQLAYLLNFDVNYWQMTPRVIFMQIGAGLLTPLSAALMPILRGARTTVREAISANQLDNFGNGLIDRLLGHLQRGSAAMRYALRNMFRRKVRLALTLCALAVGGAIFITVLNTIASLRFTINSDTAAYWQQDITVNFKEPYRGQLVAEEGQRIPGVIHVEGWSTQTGFRTYADGRESREDIALFGAPVDSAFIQPTLLAGRWLRPDDTQALVANVYLMLKEPDLRVGSNVTIKIKGRETSWQIVGVVTSQMIGFTELRPEMPIAYAPYPALSRSASETGKVDRIVIRLAEPARPLVDVVVDRLEAHFARRNFQVRSIETNAKLLQVVNRLIGILTALLTFAAMLFAAVGGLSLTSTMTLNVLERIREIGVLRAIGGSNQTIRAIILYEGAAVGLLSWLLGVIGSIPLSLLMNYALGRSFFAVPLRNSFPLFGPLLWLLLAVLIALLASYFPARNAARLSVREILAYS